MKDVQLREITGAGVACVRVRGCVKEGGEPCTHVCHFNETHDNAAKMESQVHYRDPGELGNRRAIPGNHGRRSSKPESERLCTMKHMSLRRG